MPRASTLTQKLTKRTVEAAKPRDRRFRISDSDQPGFYLMVWPSGTKSFGVRYNTADGKQSERKLGDYPSVLPATAREEAQRLRSDVYTAGADPAEDARKARQAGVERRQRTFAALAEEYLLDMELRARKRVSTIAKERQHINKHLVPQLGRFPVDEISTRDLTTALMKIRTAASELGKSGSSAANDCLKYARQILKYGQRLEWLPKERRAWEDVEKFDEAPREREASNDELKALWAQWETRKRENGSRGWNSATALQFMALTLQRGEEVVSMSWDEVDLKARLWTIPGDRKKENRAAAVPLSDQAIAILREAKDRNPEDFGPFRGRTGATLKRASLTQSFERDRQTLGIDDLTPHDLRRTGRTAITNPERLGFPPFIGEVVISHAIQDSLVRTYDRNSYLSEKRRALEAWGRELERVVTDADEKDEVVVSLYPSESREA